MIDLNKLKRDIIYDNLNDFPLYKYIDSLGSFGKVVFRVSENNVLTPKGYSITNSHKVNKHERLSAEEISEFKNRELKKISMEIKLIYSLVNVKSTLKELSRITEEGESYPLILGRTQIGKNNFRLQNFTLDIKKTDGLGNPLIAECKLNFEEYIQDIDRVSIIETAVKGTQELKGTVIDEINKVVINQLKGARLW